MKIQKGGVVISILPSDFSKYKLAGWEHKREVNPIKRREAYERKLAREALAKGELHNGDDDTTEDN